ncbi:sugar phosphate phosphatase [Blautia obeum]|uniref:Sugar phosphate phosphatase n=1 Tax=Blautia obeum TaxID=40520 RepID=A0A174SGQ4_9FIRM|nr:sugar phosphate phosphatase [Blautia obeum]
MYGLLDKEIPDIYVTSSVPNLMEIGHKDAGKGKTLLWLLNELGISPEEAMAFGDADNDISMLTAVKYGIAMANGTENCKKAACFVTDTNENDGVVQGILKLGIYSLEK